MLILVPSSFQSFHIPLWTPLVLVCSRFGLSRGAHVSIDLRREVQTFGRAEGRVCMAASVL